MRQFSFLPSSGQAYGPVDTDLHYYVPREALIEQAYSQLVGENPNEGGLHRHTAHISDRKQPIGRQK